MSKQKRQPRIQPYPVPPEHEVHSSVRPTAADLKRGLRAGAWYGVGYSLIALLIYAVSGDRPFEHNGVTLAGAVLVYLVGGVAAGSIAGTALAAIRRFPPLAYPVGIVAAAPAAFGTMAMVSHKFSGWGGAEWAAAATMSIAYGIIGVRVVRA